MLDVEVIDRVKSGDAKAFELLFHKYKRPLVYAVNKYTKDTELAQDVVQESFFKIYKSLHKFEGRCSFKNWVYRITLNTAKNKIRNRRYHENIDNKEPSYESKVEEVLVYKDLKKCLYKLVNQLPEKQKKSLMLRIYKDMSFKEIAQEMQCPYDTAKANYRHALLKIKKMFIELYVIV